MTPQNTILSQKRIIRYIERNPGLTATQLCRLLRPAATLTVYTPGSFITKLHRLAGQSKIERRKEYGARNDAPTWRWYPRKIKGRRVPKIDGVFAHLSGIDCRLAALTRRIDYLAGAPMADNFPKVICDKLGKPKMFVDEGATA